MSENKSELPGWCTLLDRLSEEIAKENEDNNSTIQHKEREPPKRG